MIRGWSAIALILVASPCSSQPADLVHFDRTVEKVEELVRRHRFGAVIELLEPLDGLSENSETRYLIAAELGRAHYHLGHYSRAYDYLRQAVAIRPDRVETALYLEGASYLTADRDQALAIFAEVLESGARDLYLAVSLPGERSFLADPDVWRLLERHQLPIRLDLTRRSIGGVELGQPRSDVARTLEAPADAAGGPLLAARAGPHVVWRCAFSDPDRLTEMTVFIEPLLRYTPFRLHLGDGDWRITPAKMIAAFGPPMASAAQDDEAVVLRWQLSTVELDATFGRLAPPRPPSAPGEVALLRVVRLAETTDPGLDDSDSMSP